jgi:DHA2 family multidrug resistance protein
VLNNQIDLHLTRLHEAVTWSRGPAVETLNNLMARFAEFGSAAQSMALKELTLIVHRQAMVMAFADVFLIVSALFVAIAALAIVMKRPAARAGGVGGH